MPSGPSSGNPKMYCGCEGTLLLTAAFGRRNKDPADWTSSRASGRISWLQQHSVCVCVCAWAVTFCAIKESGWFILGDVQPFLFKRKKEKKGGVNTSIISEQRCMNMEKHESTSGARRIIPDPWYERGREVPWKKKKKKGSVASNLCRTAQAAGKFVVFYA